MAISTQGMQLHITEVRNAFEAKPQSCLESLALANAPRKAMFTLFVALAMPRKFIEFREKERWFVRGSYTDVIRAVTQERSVNQVLIASNILGLHASIGSGSNIQVYLTPPPPVVKMAKELRTSPTPAFEEVVKRFHQ